MKETLLCPYYEELYTADADTLLGKCQHKLCIVDILKCVLEYITQGIQENTTKEEFQVSQCYVSGQVS